MKTIFRFTIFTASVAIITLMGCTRKESFDMNGSPNTGSLPSLDVFFAEQGAQMQFFTIDNNLQQTITGAQGTIVTFNANTFVTLAGNPVTGLVTIHLKEIYGKKNMLLSNVPTNAELYPGGPKEPLISGGEFYIDAFQGSAQLKMATGQTYNAFLPSTITPNSSMSLFRGEETEDGVLWGPNIDSSSFLFPSSAPQGYFANCDSLRWSNADCFLYSPSYAPITLSLSGTYSPTQVMAFAWYDNVNVIWSFREEFNSVTNSFPDDHTANGVPLHFIVISVKNGKLYTGIVAATATANGVYTVNMTETDETIFANSLNALQ